MWRAKNATRKRKRMTLSFWSVALYLLPLTILASACTQDMSNQPKYIPLRPSPFFDDGKSARSLVSGTVARGELREDVLLYTGRSRVLPGVSPEQASPIEGSTIPP